MDLFLRDRSTRFMVGVGGVLLLGLLLAYTLPAIGANGEFEDDESLGFSETGEIVSLMTDRGWTYDISRLGVVVAIIAAIALPRPLSAIQRVIVTIGALAGLAFPLLGVRPILEGDSLGIGLILFSVANLVAVALAWVLRDPSPPEPV